MRKIQYMKDLAQLTYFTMIPNASNIPISYFIHKERYHTRAKNVFLRLFKAMILG